MPEADPSIHGVPPEVLAQIFRDLHFAEGHSSDRHEWNNTNDEVILKRAFTPYSVSSVCKYWDEVSTLASEMWNRTRILLSLDIQESVSPAQMALNYLQRAPHGEPFVVHIMCADGSDGSGRECERRKVMDLLTVLSIHLPRISELCMLTRFETSLPPFRLLCPPPVPLALKTLTVKTLKGKSRQDASPPSLYGCPTPYVTNLQYMDLAGSTFISYCRTANRLYHPSECRPKQTLIIRNLSSASEGFTLDELLEFLEQIAFQPTKLLHLIDVDLHHSCLASECYETAATLQDGVREMPGTLALTRVNAEIVSALLLLYRRRACNPDSVTIFIDNCALPSPTNVDPITVTKLSVQSLNTSSIINILHAIDPEGIFIVEAECDIGNGAELLHQFEIVRRSNGDPLLSRTQAIWIRPHRGVALDPLCQFVETMFARSRDQSFLDEVRIAPTVAHWMRMQADASDRWVTQRINKAIGAKFMAWDVNIMNCRLMVQDTPAASIIFIMFINW
ncbi:hypothetical protein BKA70DRAFT_1411514 [Coprinopsis sp. MPI-PUGE-AT-0042]|nr:hypothetical protein BKA70DRAFT_1411514 [Coprinopsis sp. MPI-PUGE-AT-0042]